MSTKFKVWAKKTDGGFWSSAWIKQDSSGGFMLTAQAGRNVVVVDLTRDDMKRLRDYLDGVLEF